MILDGINGVVFDCDGVIIDSEPFWREAELTVLSSAGYELSAEHLLKNTGRRAKDLVFDYQRIYGFSQDFAQKLIRDIHDYVVNKINENAIAMPGLYQAIDYFLSKGKKLAIASSAPTFLLDAVLNKLNLHRSFKIICSAENEEYGKPHPVVYLNACKKLELLPTSCIAIEDSLNGLIAAKAARMFCILVLQQSSEFLPAYSLADKVIIELTEINDSQFSTDDFTNKA